MKLIDADILIKDLTGMKSAYDAISLDGMFKALKEAPTVEERPRGEWINHLDLTEDYCGESKQCSLCGYKDYNTRRFLWHKFCPNCGADMRGEGE